MSAALDLASWVLAVVVALPCLVLIVEIATGLQRPRNAPAPVPARAVVIIPAHDEALVIEPTLRSVFAVAPPGTRVLVVADNCSDETAAIARRCGAEVIERSSRDRRGKGYALAFGRDHLVEQAARGGAAPAPDAVIVLDADCRIAPGAIERLAGACVASGRAVQGRNLLGAGDEASPLVQISSFAFLVKNLVRAQGLYRLSGSVPLMGTGMAFPWALFSRLPLASGHLAEDMELGLHLIRQGEGAVFVPGAGVTSPPAAKGDTLTQRRRWEHGFLSIALRQALPLVGAGLGRGNPRLMAHGLTLLVPPLALMALMILATLAVLAAGVAAGASPAPLACFAAVALLATAMVLAAWAVYGRGLLRPGTLLRVPLYVVWKLPLYLRILGRRETSWTRTRRL